MSYYHEKTSSYLTDHGVKSTLGADALSWSDDRKQEVGLFPASSVSYNYNDNYDPTFDGNEETVKEKGSPKQDLKKDLDLAQLKKLIAEDKGNTSSIVEVISVVNFSGQKKGLYKHVNGKEYTVLGATVKGLYNTMTFHSQDQPLFFS